MSIYKNLLTRRKTKKKGKKAAENRVFTNLEGLGLLYRQDSNLI